MIPVSNFRLVPSFKEKDSVEYVNTVEVESVISTEFGNSVEVEYVNSVEYDIVFLSVVVNVVDIAVKVSVIVEQPSTSDCVAFKSENKRYYKCLAIGCVAKYSHLILCQSNYIINLL